MTIVGFEQEQMILARLTGPHVPRFVAAGDFERPYIVMEHVAGRSLATHDRQAPLPADEVARIGARVADALHDIHQQHVIHLDLKPSNIIQRDNEGVVLIDFGLSRHLQLPDLIGEEFDSPVGTGAYVAPEQVRRSRGRSAQRHLRARRHPLPAGDRRIPVRRAGARIGVASAAVARPASSPLVESKTCRHGCRRSSCAASRSSRPPGTKPRRSCASSCSIPTTWCSPPRAERRNRDGAATVFMRWLANRNAPRVRARDAAGLLDRSPIIMGGDRSVARSRGPARGARGRAASGAGDGNSRAVCVRQRVARPRASRSIRCRTRRDAIRIFNGWSN